MNAPVTMISFASAYRQLRPVEKAFVDAYVSQVEREAVRANERISLALHRPVPADVVAAAGGMFERPLVCAAITERINDIAAASELTAHRVLKEYMAIGFASIGDYMELDEVGMPIFNLASCTPEQLAAVKSIKVEETTRSRKIEVTLHGKIDALNKLAEHMGLLERDNPVWRADQARPITPPIAANSSVEDAAELYARTLG